MGIRAAAPPATVRNTNPAEMHNSSTTGTLFSFSEYARLINP